MENLSDKELIKKIRENGKQAKAAYEEIFKRHYQNGCKWASAYLSKKVYSDLIPIDRGEVDSLVHVAFLRTISSYNLEMEKPMSFKNYFYQLIQYQAYAELRRGLNWKVIPQYENLCHNYKRNLEMDMNYEYDHYRNIETREKIREITEYLGGKKEEYAIIFRFKSMGLKNRQIAQYLEQPPSYVKGKMQYIKKLVLNHFDQNFYS